MAHSLLFWPVLLAAMLCVPPLVAGNEPLRAPRTVKALWSGYDPCSQPLDIQVVREWEKEGIVFRYITYEIGTFKGDPNTDWGAVDPTQQNVPGYFNLQPGDKYLDPFESPHNNNWYLLTLGARRGLTFLEQQPQVDPERLGVYGHSMGGNLTVYVAGTDDRVKVAAPSVGGSGSRTYPWPLLPEQRKHNPKGDVELFRATLGFQSYSPHVKAPLIWLGATNDFHGIMDDTYRTAALMPQERVRFAFTPHMNHRFTPEFAVTRPLWIDQHLKGTIRFPTTPVSTLVLSTDDGVPVFRATPDEEMPVTQAHIYYSIDPDPQARFWRSSDAIRTGNTWSAKLPIMSSDQPLFAFANVHYRLTEAQSVPFVSPTRTFAISSLMHTATPEDLKREGVRATDTASMVIDDFSQGFQDWYTLSPDNPHHWQFWARKITDPKWRGRPGYRLALDVKTEKPNELVIVLTENFFRGYRGKKQDFAAVVKLAGGDQWQTVSLSPDDFKAVEGERVLSSWAEADLLGLRAYCEEGERLLGSKTWAGSQPTLQNLRWAEDRNTP